MINYDYYNGLDNLRFEDYEVSDKYACIKISYIPKHAGEDILLLSKLVYNDRETILKEKTKWLLQEVEFPYEELPLEDLINVDTMYVPKHAKHLA